MTYGVFRAVRMCAAFFLVGVCLSGCRQSRTVADATQLQVAAVVAVGRGQLTNTLDVAGQFLPYQEVELHAKVAGYIRRINVDIGDHVRAGQVLATLDVPELEAQVQGASATVRQTQEQIGRARSEVLRAQADYEGLHAAAHRLRQASAAQPGLIAEQELDTAMARDRAAAAQVDAAKSALSATQQQMGVSQSERTRAASMADYSRIVAPFSGVVTARFADTGALIQAGTSNAGSMPVVKVAQVDKLRLRLPVPEALAMFVHTGDAARIRVESLGRSFSGTITRDSASLDMATRTMQVEIDVPNAKGELQPGMYAQVSLDVQRSGDVVVVPVQAVERSQAQAFVLVVDAGGHVQKRSVQVGLSGATQTEILRGLNAGEQVIVANLASFQPGQQVKAKTSGMANAEVQ